jgi:hypothetical protein
LRLILHVGHPKCGSTTVQSLLWNNRDWLAERGMALLGADFRLPGEDPSWDWPLWYVNQPLEGARTLADQLVAGLPRWTAMGVDTLVLSAENLSDPVKLGQLEPAFRHFETSAIYYIRRQDEFLVSSWRQWAMKRGISLHQHILRRVAEGNPAYRATLDYLATLLGHANVHTRFLDPDFLTGCTLATDVWQALGLSGTPPSAPDRANPSPDRASLIFLSRNPQLFSGEHDDAAAQILLAADREPPRRLSVDRHVQRSLKLLYDAENIALARDFMAGRDGSAIIRLDAPDKDELELSPSDIARLKAMLPRIDHPEIAAAIARL